METDSNSKPVGVVLTDEVMEGKTITTSVKKAKLKEWYSESKALACMVDTDCFAYVDNKLCVYNKKYLEREDKHENFSTEQEIRISPLFVNENDKHLQCKILNTIRQVYILNLTELCEKEGKDFEDLFDSIVIGPTSKQTVRDLQFYCKNNGLLKLGNKVKKSDCPLR